MNVITCEQVSNGHPDKICDQIADAIVTDCLKYDPTSRVAVEVLLKDNHVVLAGEITSNHTPSYRDLVLSVMDSIGWSKLDYGTNRMRNILEITNYITRQSPDIALGVDVGGAGDQGMMFGFATNETLEFLPLPYVLATRFLEKLRDYPSDKFKADAKAQVSFDYDAHRITTFLCSVQHSPSYSPSDFISEITQLMISTAEEYNLNTDFEVLVNPTGRFVLGGSWSDCGVTGRKLACDTYGGVGRLGGGAMSGKDPTKVDRSGAYAARKIAKDLVKYGYAEEAEVQIAYAIGVDHPVSIHVNTFGTAKESDEVITAFVNSYDLSPRAIVEGLRLTSIDYNRVSSYGHFGKSDLPWE